MMNAVKNVFFNLSYFVDKNPLMGLMLIIIFVCSGGLLIYNFGKEIGEYIYLLTSNS